MSVQVKRRRDSAVNVAAFTGAQGELVVDTTNNRVTVHDGVTAGGWAAAKLSEVVTTKRVAVSDADYAALASDRLIAYTTLSAARIVTLPSASAYPVGAVLRIVDESGDCSGSATITISRAGSDTVAGAANLVLNGAYQSVGLESNGSNGWGVVESGLNDTFAAIGIGTAPDLNNPLSVYGASALFDGVSFSFTINKSAVGDTASVLFQDGFSGRAQMGLNGSDDFSFKVSADGSSWKTAIALDAATGGMTIAPGAATKAPLCFQSGANASAAEAGAWEYDGIVFYSTPVAAQRGVTPSEQFVCLSSSFVLTSTTAVQPLFNATANGAIALAAGTYQFECLFSLSAMSGTSGSFGFALGGTASFAQGWWSCASKAALATASSDYTTFNTAANAALTAANTATTGYARIKGIVRVTNSGTIIPRVSLGVAAAAVVGANSWFKITPLGSSSVTNVGNWS